MSSSMSMSASSASFLIHPSRACALVVMWAIYASMVNKKKKKLKRRERLCLIDEPTERELEPLESICDPRKSREWDPFFPGPA